MTVYKFMIHGVPNSTESVQCIWFVELNIYDLFKLLKSHFDLPDNYVFVD